MEASSVMQVVFLAVVFILIVGLCIEGLSHSNKLDKHELEMKSIKDKLSDVENTLSYATRTLDNYEKIIDDIEEREDTLDNMVKKGFETKTFYFFRDIKPETLSLGMVENHKITILKKDDYGSNVKIGFLSLKYDGYFIGLRHVKQIGFTPNSMIDEPDYKKYSDEIANWFNRDNIIKRLTED